MYRYDTKIEDWRVRIDLAAELVSLCQLRQSIYHCKQVLDNMQTVSYKIRGGADGDKLKLPQDRRQ